MEGTQTGARQLDKIATAEIVVKGHPGNSRFTNRRLPRLRRQGTRQQTTVRREEAVAILVLMSTRRVFLVKLAAGAVSVTAVLAGAQSLAAAAGRAAISRAARPIATLGIQLYTVRDAMAADFEGTLERLAGMGYDEVEFAGYFGRSPAHVRAILDGLGLDAPAAHVPLEALRDELEATLDMAAAAGHSWVVCPWIAPAERSSDGYLQLADLLNRAGEAGRKLGLRVAYHNHEFEFEPLGSADTLPLELLLRRTDPTFVDFELDLFWVAQAGHESLDWFARHPGRFPLVHVKDMDGSTERRMVDPGRGVIDFPAIVDRREQAGIRHWFVEHDQPENPFGTARVGIDYLRGLRSRSR
jgi:sugar phosphate isomerase/epimerase